jgi:hypothetical protein
MIIYHYSYLNNKNNWSKFPVYYKTTIFKSNAEYMFIQRFWNQLRITKGLTKDFKNNFLVR